MKDPLIHSRAEPTLPRGHWMLTAVPGDDWACVRCGIIVYRRNANPEVEAEGTAVTWIEHGLTVGSIRTDPLADPVDDKDPNPPIVMDYVHLLCLLCFHADTTVVRKTADWWMLADDNQPQPPRLAGWIAQNIGTRRDDLFYTIDGRIPFYEGFEYAAGVTA